MAQRTSGFSDIGPKTGRPPHYICQPFSDWRPSRRWLQTGTRAFATTDRWPERHVAGIDAAAEQARPHSLISVTQPICRILIIPSVEAERNWS